MNIYLKILLHHFTEGTGVSVDSQFITCKSFFLMVHYTFWSRFVHVFIVTLNLQQSTDAFCSSNELKFHFRKRKWEGRGEQCVQEKICGLLLGPFLFYSRYLWGNTFDPRVKLSGRLTYVFTVFSHFIGGGR